SDMFHFTFGTHGDSVLQRMNMLREERRFCDVTLRISNSEFHGHKVVLAASSPFLRDQFLLHESREVNVSVLQNAEIGRRLMLSCYTGVLEFPMRELVSYLTAASALQMSHVVERCTQAVSQYLDPTLANLKQERGSEDALSEPERDPGSASVSEEQPHPAHPRAHGLQALRVPPLQEGLQPEGHTPGPHQPPHGEQAPQCSELFSVYTVFYKKKVMGMQNACKGSTCDVDYSLKRNTSEGIFCIGGSDDRNYAEERVLKGAFLWRERLSELNHGKCRTFTFFFTKLCFGSDKIKRTPLMVHRHSLLSFTATLFYATKCHEQDHEETALNHIISLPVKRGRNNIHSSPRSPPPQPEEENPDGEEDGAITIVKVESIADVSNNKGLQWYHQCPKCARVFRQLENYANHLKMHKLFMCLLCGKTFTQKGNLHRHMRVHAGIKPFQCKICGKTFTQKCSLLDHLNLHSGDKPHKCNYCDMVFAHKPVLRKHLKQIHGKNSFDNA
uniref:Uncharacterized protein n=1 Tax=Lepisosteus oculatus TaxID=7918 RepID=W5M4W1_LEPOC